MKKLDTQTRKKLENEICKYLGLGIGGWASMASYLYVRTSNNIRRPIKDYLCEKL